MAKKKKTTAGKIDKHYWDSMNLMDDREDEDYDDLNLESKATKMKKEVVGNYNNDFQGKLRKIFFPDEFKEPTKEEYKPKDYTYIQMKLNIENLSEDFVKELEEYRLSGINIRKCEEKDLPIFVKLYNRSFMRGSDPWSPATIEQFKTILKHKSTVVLIASKEGEDVGFIIIDIENEADGRDIGIIAGLGTDPRWQRQGIARFLGIASWDYFRKNFNIKELRCEVYEKNIPSYRLIKSLHFKEYGKKTYQF